MSFQTLAVPVFSFQAYRNRPILRLHIQLAAVLLERDRTVFRRQIQNALALLHGDRAVYGMDSQISLDPEQSHRAIVDVQIHRSAAWRLDQKMRAPLMPGAGSADTEFAVGKCELDLA